MRGAVISFRAISACDAVTNEFEFQLLDRILAENCAIGGKPERMKFRIVLISLYAGSESRGVGTIRKSGYRDN